MWHTAAWAHVWLTQEPCSAVTGGTWNVHLFTLLLPLNSAALQVQAEKYILRNEHMCHFHWLREPKLLHQFISYLASEIKVFIPLNSLPTPLQLIHPKSLATIRAKNSLWKPTTFWAHFKSHPLNHSLGCGHSPAFISHTHTSLPASPTKKGPTMQQAIKIPSEYFSDVLFAYISTQLLFP